MGTDGAKNTISKMGQPFVSSGYRWKLHKVKTIKYIKKTIKYKIILMQSIKLVVNFTELFQKY